MNPQEPQMNNEMNGDESAASLAFATMLQEQMMPQQEMMEQPAEGLETLETAPEQEQPEETQETPPIDLEVLKEEIKREVEEELKNNVEDFIREELRKLLEEDDEN